MSKVFVEAAERRAFNCFNRLGFEVPNLKIIYRGQLGVRTIAKAERFHDHYSIVLGGRTWPHMSEEERDATIDHEVCHIVAWMCGVDTSHKVNSGWWRLMTRLGYDPATQIRAKSYAKRNTISAKFKCCNCQANNILAKKKYELAKTQWLNVQCKYCKTILAINNMPV